MVLNTLKIISKIVYSKPEFKKSEMPRDLPSSKKVCAFGGAEKGYCGMGIRAPRRGAIKVPKTNRG
jgi:hypothetical protein